MSPRQPSEPLLTIPSAALMNIKTLSPLYPFLPLEGGLGCASPEIPDTLAVLPLNGTQLTCLHLCLHRPTKESGNLCSSDAAFGPYISTLPPDFEGHPVTWLVRQREGTADRHALDLLGGLPPSVAKELGEVAERFWDDWGVIRKCGVC